MSNPSYYIVRGYREYKVIEGVRFQPTYVLKIQEITPSTKTRNNGSTILGRTSLLGTDVVVSKVSLPFSL